MCFKFVWKTCIMHIQLTGKSNIVMTRNAIYYTWKEITIIIWCIVIFFCKVTRYLQVDSEKWNFIYTCILEYTCILDKIYYDLYILHEYQCIVNMWENEIVKNIVHTVYKSIFKKNKSCQSEDIWNHLVILLMLSFKKYCKIICIQS